MVGIDDTLKHLACSRSGDGKLRPLFGDGDRLHVELGPKALLAEFEMLHDLDRVHVVVVMK